MSRTWRRSGVGIRERKLRCGCELESWRSGNVLRHVACSFHAKADADLARHEWAHLPTARRIGRTLPPVVYVTLVAITPLCAFVSLVTQSLVIALLPQLLVPLLFRYTWRAQPEPSPRSRYTPAFTGVIEPGDYGPQDVDIASASGRYVPRGHAACTYT